MSQYNWTFLYYLLGLAAALLLGLWARSIAIRKNRTPMFWFLLGFFLPVVGLLLVYLLPAPRHYQDVREPEAATGERLRRTRPSDEYPPDTHLRKCVKCGATLLDDAEVCRVCGTPAKRR